jgi:hypothetical protein
MTNEDTVVTRGGARCITDHASSITFKRVQTICQHGTNSDAVKSREAQYEKELSERTIYIDSVK